MSDPVRVVSVEILGLRYPIRSALDPDYVAELAAYVDAKMQAASDESEQGDSLKLAVLAALNIADELYRVRDGEWPGSRPGEEFRQRIEALETTLDRALEDPVSSLATPTGTD